MPRSGVSRRHLLVSLGAAPMASMMPAAHAHTSDRTAAPPAISTEQLATLKLDVRLTAPVDAPIGSAIIVGGEAAGTNLAGSVLPGSLEWSRDTARGVTQLVLRYAVQTADGHRLQVIDRANIPSVTGLAWDHPITTTTELESMADPLAGAADAAGGLASGIVIGRLDATALGAGRLRLDLHRIV